MPLLVLAYPEFASEDGVWIEMIRAAHDPAHERVRAHFTLVYPLPDTPEQLGVEGVTALIQAVAVEFAPIRFVLRSAIPFNDLLGPDTNVFLMPDEGFGALVRLHDRLYSGPLAGALRLDLPTVPHITVARLRSPQAAKRLADTLNGRDIAIAGTIAALYLVTHDGGTVRTITRVPLGKQ
jgi:2'-5' RNA ligase